MSPSRIGSTPTAQVSADRIRRVMDVVTACGLLVLAAPIMAIVTGAILIETGRPILFSQTRLGQHGKQFRMLKFRKFHKDAGTNGLQLTRDADSRMTRVGRWLYTTKLDELPQLWNVLRGEMAIVGPRPESLAFADGFEGEFARVLDHKPGILGPSQVVFRDEGLLFANQPDPTALYRRVLQPAKARIDLQYYERRTLLGDLRWVVAGILVTLHLAPPFLERLRTVRCAPDVISSLAGVGMILPPSAG